MEQITPEDLARMLNANDGTCVSLYMPTHRVGADARQDPVRLRNLVRKASERLASHGMRPQEAEALLRPAMDMVQDPQFWSDSGDGLAVFASTDGFRSYRLPVAFQELVVVAPRFHLKPILPLLDRSDRYLVLLLNQKKVRLFRGSHFGLEEVDLKDLPTSMDAALRLDDSGKRRQFRGETGPGAAQRPSSVHGQGVVADSTEHKKDILRFFQTLDRALSERMLARETAPLVLVGAGYLLPIYREASAYKNILAEGIPLHLDGLEARELHRRVLEAVGPGLDVRRRGAVEQFISLRGTPRASESLDEIITAASGGRVLHLFTPIGVQRWGTFDLATGSATVHESPQQGDLDLLDYAAVQTLKHDGSVFAVSPDQMPPGTQLAAVFRY